MLHCVVLSFVSGFVYFFAFLGVWGFVWLGGFVGCLLLLVFAVVVLRTHLHFPFVFVFVFIAQRCTCRILIIGTFD